MIFQHPCTAEMIWKFGRFPSKQTMYRRLKILKEVGILQVVGYVPNPTDGGRPVDVLATEKWKSDNMNHEVKLSEVLLHWDIPSIRGKYVDSKLRPDATLLTVRPIHIELDTGSMNWSRVESRMKRYESCEHNVIFVTSTKTRVSGVLSRCNFLASTLLACTHNEALEGAELTDCVGEKITLNNLLKNLYHDQQAENA